MLNILKQELQELEGIHLQNPETGANIRGVDGVSTYIESYTNRVFGAPFQLLDSVDKRFDNINKYLGNEYMRHFILNSPILYIKPGMPKYTGGADGSSLVKMIKEVYLASTAEGGNALETFLMELAKNTIFSGGSKLQKRMFGFRETYYQYSSHVNYMCRSMATFLGLTDTTFYAFSGTKFNPKTNTTQRFPNGAFSNYETYTPFSSFKWENYRMLNNTTVLQPVDMLAALARSTLLGSTIETIANTIGYGLDTILTTTSAGVKDSINYIQNIAMDETYALQALEELGIKGDNLKENAADSLSNAFSTSFTDIMVDKVSSVQFMVQPGSFEESFSNTTQDSAIASTINGISDQIGNELGFITNSKVDAGVIGMLTNFLGDTAQTAGQFVSGIIEPIAGGFTSNLFTGAISSLRGQKMIYPKIYSSSELSRSYSFTVLLSSPYGDIYNYYMNIVVPLAHLINLAAPRMVTANTVQSPYLVQAYIPGMVTIDLGIINNMQIVKNPSANRVSVNGFPLDVSVTFSIEPLYNQLSISPSNDPASFLFNETLNDYMANMAGLQPSVDTYTRQRKAAFDGMANFFESGEFFQDVSNTIITQVENLHNPFIG